ncbi:hypothetical protein CXB51_028611 [Gossypium anomalum]|uniref:Protein FAR1-RELATED SEQUENCE n=1 Tax=Gossypium anomalum TaxID=47600 RepID=A0A8J5YYX7_9ROSI|nr:hypothetical protein CXB51_028611 [Gossypium anomalum]
MEFNSEKDVYDFYKKYAKKVGFISRFNGKLRVTKFIVDHTHALASPSKYMFLRSQRTTNLAQAFKLEISDNSRLTLKESVGILSRNIGGVQNLGFILKYYNNYWHTRKKKVGDTDSVDLNNFITNIFWTDGRMKLDYESFGDEVCFDTTYKKIKRVDLLYYLLVLTIIRKMSSLLYYETCNAFIWLFDLFLKALSRKKLVTILTYQDVAMTKAFAS